MEVMRLILFSAHAMEFVVQKVPLIEKVIGVEFALAIGHVMLKSTFII